MLFPVKNTPHQDFDELADELDMFIITGGDDSVLRRTIEIRLASRVMQRNKPVIGICHGAFLLTDLLGGKVEEIQNHSDTNHSVYYFGDEYYVNSYHSLSIPQTHDTATTLVVDPNGHCEAWIDKKLAGIVWHPERMEKPWIPDEIQTLFK